MVNVAPKPGGPFRLFLSQFFCNIKWLEILLLSLWMGGYSTASYPPTPPPQEEFHQLSLTGSFKSNHGDLTSKAFFFANSNPSMTRQGCRPWINFSFTQFKLIFSITNAEIWLVLVGFNKTLDYLFCIAMHKGWFWPSPTLEQI